jgi:hypothetical protein
MYKLLNNRNGQPFAVLKTEEGLLTSIPFDPANTDYQAFLAWKAEGNEPLPADEGESN